MKKALAILIICIMVSAQIMPYIDIKADTVDLSGLQERIQYVDTLVDADKTLFLESLGAGAGLSMRATGYTYIPASAIEDIGSWVWDRIYDIGDGTRQVAQWCVNKLNGIIDAFIPDHDHSSGGHRFSYSPSDTPVYNALYTDDEWNSLVSQWAQAGSHGDNFISFADVTDDVEGYMDRYWTNVYPYGMNPPDGSNITPADINAMTVQLSGQWLGTKPSLVALNKPSDNTNNPNGLIFVIGGANVSNGKTAEYLVWKFNNNYWNAFIHWSDGSETQTYNSGYASTGYFAYRQSTIASDGTTPQHYLFDYTTGLSSSNLGGSSSMTGVPAYFTGVWDEATATSRTYTWYHTTVASSTVRRVFNIHCYYLDPNTNTLYPYSVHPGAHEEWTAPTLTPIIINNNRTYLTVNNNTAITDYDTVINNITNNTYSSETVINNVFNNTVINVILPDPDYVEGPDDPTPEPVTPIPTPTPTGTPTDTPTGSPAYPTPPYEITGTVEVTNIPTQFDVWVVNPSGSPVPVTIVEPSGQGTDADDWDFGIDIPFPDIDDLTTSSNITNSRLVTSVEQSQGVDLSYGDITGGFLNVIPAGLRDILLLVLFIAIVICFITRW